MATTPGMIIPSYYPAKADLKKDLQRRNEKSGFVFFDPNLFDKNDLVMSDPLLSEFLKQYGVK